LVFVSNIAMQSVAGSASARDDAPPPKECRICRQSGDAEMPLFRPCRCDGSIRYVHEACLEQWISRKRTSHCEVCTYPIQFEQVVQGSIDNIQSWQLSLGIAKRFARHIRQFIWCFFVAAVWGIILPLFTNALFNIYFSSDFSYAFMLLLPDKLSLNDLYKPWASGLVLNFLVLCLLMLGGAVRDDLENRNEARVYQQQQQRQLHPQQPVDAGPLVDRLAMHVQHEQDFF